MVKQWPHTGTITYLTAGTTNATNGIYTEGSLNSVVIEKCNIQPRGGLASYVIGGDGDRVKVNYVVYMPTFSQVNEIPDTGVNFQFLGKELLVLEFWDYQKGVRLKC